jgi:hypothetical protein
MKRKAMLLTESIVAGGTDSGDGLANCLNEAGTSDAHLQLRVD